MVHRLPPSGGEPVEILLKKQANLESQQQRFWEDWMRRIDQLLEDEELLATVHEALLKRHAQSQTRGRQGTRPRWWSAFFC